MSQNDKKGYKDTLNLPQTSFDMKANLLKKEPAIQQQWAKQNLYGLIRKQREGRKRYILHDGPPYANGNIHMGTALNKVLKDIVVRTRTMTGYDAPYIPGWDCHGLPIEQKVMDETKAKASQTDAMDIRRQCKKYAQTFTSLQADQFKRLGVMGLFEDPYITMNPNYEADVLEVFARLVERNLVYRQLKPVHWSIENQTALADAELEYHDRQDPSIFVTFKVSRNASAIATGDVYLMIWTTTPWTLPANLAIAAHPNLTYCAVSVETADGQATWVIAQSRVEQVMSLINSQRPGWVRNYSVSGSLTGKELVDANVAYTHVIAEGQKEYPVVLAEYVTVEDGTGLVHTAPGHGLEDYGTGLKYGLDIYCPVKANGTYDDTVAQWLRGVHVWKANTAVIEHLEKNGALIVQQMVTHSYPHDWRSRTPTIFRATEQWFIGVDRKIGKDESSLRKMAMDLVARTSDGSEDAVNFVPAWGRNRIAGMLQTRPDWCISRQRAWGLPIPAFFNEQGESLMTPASIRTVANVIRKHGSDAWFTMSPAELLEGYKPSADKRLANPQAFDIANLSAGRDIFDVWFESGSSWFAVAMSRGLVEDIPVDLYLEGSDQHRGWFQLSLLPALGVRGKAPFKTLLTHGFVVDDTGRKMSKSLGNVIDVMKQLDKRGADILRLWIASQNYQDDVRCSEGLIAQAEDAYRKIRNTLRFCMGACFDFDPKMHRTEPTEHSIDNWIRMQLHRLIRDVREAYDAFEFHKAARLMYEFCTVEASSVYLSAVKDRLYCETPSALRRRASQTVIHEMLHVLIKLLAPILPHTCEEAWKCIPSRNVDEPDSIHLAMLDDYDEDVLNLAEDYRPVNPDLGAFSGDQIEVGPAWIWDRLLELRNKGMVKLEALKKAGVKNSLDTECVLKVARDNKLVIELLDAYHKELEDMLGVGYARIEQVDALPEGLAVDVEILDIREKYNRCERSWKRRPDVGSNPRYPDLSARDAAVMEELEG